jgi:hypothetical protein
VSNRSPLTRADQFRPSPPPKVGSEELKREVDEVLNYNANLLAGTKSDCRIYARRTALDRAIGTLAEIRASRFAP